MGEAIKIGDLSDPHQVERFIMAVAQHICCEEGCRLGGLGCAAHKHREEARRQIASAPIVDAPDE